MAKKAAKPKVIRKAPAKAKSDNKSKVDKIDAQIAKLQKEKEKITGESKPKGAPTCNASSMP